MESGSTAAAGEIPAAAVDFHPEDSRVAAEPGPM
jgi:hypothetical protein